MDPYSNQGQSPAFEEPDLQLPSGTLLSSTLHTYRLDRVLGQGGFGITYAALSQGQNQTVAVKEYFPVRCSLRNPDRSVSPKPGREEEYQSGLNSFTQEARMLAALENFPSVVRVLDSFQAGGTAYLVMEYLDGIPLHQKAAQLGGRIPPEELLPKLPALLRDLAVEPAETLFVGDSDVDVYTGHNGGLSVCGVTWGFRGRQELEAAGADHLADTPEALGDYILA